MKTEQSKMLAISKKTQWVKTTTQKCMKRFIITDRKLEKETKQRKWKTSVAIWNIQAALNV